jgi:hypothetical protein
MSEHTQGCTPVEERAAAKVVQVCIEECGGKPSQFEGMAYFLGIDRALFEWRFQGALGFGGKLKWQKGRGFYVTCYREDENDERRTMMDAANERLEQIEWRPSEEKVSGG